MIRSYFLPVVLLLFFAACKSDTKVPLTSSSPSTETTASQKKDGPVKVMTEATLDLTRYGMANDGANKLGGLKVGTIAPDFTLKDQSGKDINLYSMLSTSNVALSFYRGHWCGYCSRQMVDYMADLDRLKDAGIELVAITPETSEQNMTFTNENELEFLILSDDDHEAAKAYMGYFKVTPEYVKKLSEDFLAWNNDTEAQLNVPATYVIGKDKKIKYAYYDNDYSKRAKVTDLLNAL